MYAQASNIYNRLQDTFGIANSYNAIGVLMMEISQNRKSIKYLKKCIPYFKEYKEKKYLMSTYSNIGGIFARIEELDSALYYLNKCQYVVRKNKGLKLSSSAVNNIASVHEKKGQIDSALLYYNIGLDNYVNNINLTITFLENKLWIYTRKRLFKKGEKLIPQILDNIKKTSSLNIKKEAYTKLYLFYEKQNNNQKALLYLKKIVNLQGKIFHLEKNKIVNELDAKYEISRKEKELQLIKKEKNLQEVQLEQEATKNGFYQVLIIISIISLVLFSIALYQGKQKLIAQQKLNTQQEELSKKSLFSLEQTKKIETLSAKMDGQEQERKRIAQELHDNLGSLLSTVKYYYASLQPELSKFGFESPKIKKIHNFIDQACNEVRKVAHTLHDDGHYGHNLDYKIKELVNRLKDSDDMEAEYYAHGVESLNLSPLEEKEIYHMTSELVNNVIKHANARHLVISLTFANHELTIIIEDDGKGIENVDISNGMGWKTIQERTQSMNGSFNIDSRLEQGTTAVLEFKNLM